MIEKTFKASNCNLNFFEHNIGAQETILFIHGWTAGWEVWMNDIEKYGAKYNIYAVDLPGHNKSGKLKKYTLNNYFDPIYEFFLSLKKELILVGHSLGASLSFLIATKSQSISKLVLEDPPWYSETRGEINTDVSNDEFVKSQIKRYEIQRNFFINQKKTWRTSIDALRALREFDHESYKKYPERVAIRAIWAFHNDVNIWNVEDDWAWEDAVNLSKQVNAKTLLIGGNTNKGSLMTESIAEKVKMNINDCQLEYIDSGHNIRLERPDEYYKLLDKFI
ncbi:MAG: alpha/beta hydrolase [Chloroflexota bacterium]|nr:alpha/beta hydrolase [Chloroflexota bacterium]MEC8713059.1 alpha/beta hydrolase [Chloroflexota bacterium]